MTTDNDEEVFIASNGLRIRTDDQGYLTYDRGDGSTAHPVGHPSGSSLAIAVKEYYQHLRDVELGRWRYPADPDFVVYRSEDNDDGDGRAVRVLHEPDGDTLTAWEDTIPERCLISEEEVAKAYFDAHPLSYEPSEAEIEAAAKVLHDSHFQFFGWEARDEQFKEVYRDRAKAALIAAGAVRS